MIYFNEVKGENSWKDNPHYWPQIPDHQYRILIVGRSGSEKLMLLNLTNHQRKMLKSLFTLKIYTNQGISIS